MRKRGNVYMQIFDTIENVLDDILEICGKTITAYNDIPSDDVDFRNALREANEEANHLWTTVHNIELDYFYHADGVYRN